MRARRGTTKALLGATAGVLAAVAVAAAVAVPALSAGRAPSVVAVTPKSDYLALGDSVTFGYRETTTTPAPDYADAASFVAYPEDVATALDLHVANAACPGETSLSLREPKVQSNGCENSPGGGPGYRSAYPLHVHYAGTQLAFALAYLKAHPSTRLVTLMIGANDAFLCQETTTDHCSSEIAGVLTQVKANVAATLKAIRARYHGQVVIVNYYSLDYASSTDDLGSQALNSAVDAAAKPYGVSVADGYGALLAAAAQSAGDSCAAGLLTQLSGGGCGVHPSLAGQALLALAVERAIRH